MICRGRIARYVRGSEGPSRHIITIGLSVFCNTSHRHRHRRAVVRGHGLFEFNALFIGALNCHVCRNKRELRSRRVLHRDDLNRSGAVACIVRSRKCPRQHIVVRVRSSRRLLRHHDLDRATRIYCSGIIKHHVVRTLHRVVRGDKCEFRRRSVLHGDGLDSHCAVARFVRRCERARDDIVAQGIRERRVLAQSNQHIAPVASIFCRGELVVDSLVAFHGHVCWHRGKDGTFGVRHRDHLGVGRRVATIVRCRERARDSVIAGLQAVRCKPKLASTVKLNVVVLVVGAKSISENLIVQLA